MICAIVLAAGCSSRMGTQKLLLPFGKITVISHIANQLIKSEVKKHMLSPVIRPNKSLKNYLIKKLQSYRYLISDFSKVMIYNYLNEKYQVNCPCRSSIRKLKYTDNTNVL